LTVDGVCVRVVGHHVQQGRQFPDFLKQALTLPAPAILVRDGAVAVSGPRTLERLAAFKTGRTFLHLSRPHVAEAYALGEVLAAMREGNFDDVVALPAPAHAGIIAALGRIERIRHHPVVVAIMAAAASTRCAPDAVAQVVRPQELPDLGSPAGSGAAPVPPDSGRNVAARCRGGDRLPGAVRDAALDETQVEEAVAAIMRRERWLVLERLRRDLSRGFGLRVGLSRLRGVLARESLRSRLTCHPENILERADIHIVIWAGD
jgi:hypothetical protein